MSNFCWRRGSRPIFNCPSGCRVRWLAFHAWIVAGRSLPVCTFARLLKPSGILLSGTLRAWRTTHCVLVSHLNVSNSFYMNGTWHRGKIEILSCVHHLPLLKVEPP